MPSSDFQGADRDSKGDLGDLDDGPDGAVVGMFDQPTAAEIKILERVAVRWKDPLISSRLPTWEDLANLVQNPAQTSLQPALNEFLRFGFLCLTSGIISKAYETPDGNLLPNALHPEVEITTSVFPHTVSISCSNESALGILLAKYRSGEKFELPLDTLADEIRRDAIGNKAPESDEIDHLEGDDELDLLDDAEIQREGEEVMRLVTCALEEACELTQMLRTVLPMSFELRPGQAVIIRGCFEK